MRTERKIREDYDRSSAAGPDRPRPKVPLRLATLALLTAALITLSLAIAFPFLHAITWGLALAIMAWPLHQKIRARVSNASAAASLSTFVVLLLIVVPGVFVTYEVGREAEEIARKTETPPQEMVTRDSLKEMPGGKRVVTWMERVDIDVEAQLQKAVMSLVPDPKGVAQNSITAAVQFFVAMFILFYAFRDRGEFAHGLRELLPLTRTEADRVLVSAADSVHATLYATVVTGLIDAVTFTLLFWAVGVPAPFLWGAVMFVLSILPVVGAGLVWFPMGVYLATTGSWASALVILGWGATTAVLVDYILYARLAGDRMRMHPVAALLSFLGGLAVFGLSGMILGPAIVAMTAAMLDLWRKRSRGAGSAMADAA